MGFGRQSGAGAGEAGMCAAETERKIVCGVGVGSRQAKAKVGQTKIRANPLLRLKKPQKCATAWATLLGEKASVCASASALRCAVLRAHCCWPTLPVGRDCRAELGCVGAISPINFAAQRQL